MMPWFLVQCFALALFVSCRWSTAPAAEEEEGDEVPSYLIPLATSTSLLQLRIHGSLSPLPKHFAAMGAITSLIRLTLQPSSPWWQGEDKYSSLPVAPLSASSQLQELVVDCSRLKKSSPWQVWDQMFSMALQGLTSLSSLQLSSAHIYSGSAFKRILSLTQLRCLNLQDTQIHHQAFHYVPAEECLCPSLVRDLVASCPSHIKLHMPRGWGPQFMDVDLPEWWREHRDVTVYPAEELILLRGLDALQELHLGFAMWPSGGTVDISGLPVVSLCASIQSWADVAVAAQYFQQSASQLTSLHLRKGLRSVARHLSGASNLCNLTVEGWVGPRDLEALALLPQLQTLHLRNPGNKSVAMLSGAVSGPLRKLTEVCLEGDLRSMRYWWLDWSMWVVPVACVLIAGICAHIELLEHEALMLSYKTLG